MSWSPPQRPNDYAEQALIKAILDGTFPPGSTLPGERTLALELGVTRPTLREVMQRLARDGWLTVRHGKPTAVNNYWQEGGLNVLSTLLQHSADLPPGFTPDFIAHLLEVRLLLAPAYTRAAVRHQAATIADYLTRYHTLPDTPEALAAFDWGLHHCLTIASGNPIYTLILNGFADFYKPMARLYFATPTARQASRQYYAALETAVHLPDPIAAETLTHTVMADSLAYWQLEIAKPAP